MNATFYLPWTDPSVTASSVRPGDAESWRYSIQFDHVTGAPGESIRVDRSSLDSAVANSGWDLQSYEVHPDRVVLYLWPPAGGTTFSFSLKARFPMKAQSSESILYDYYNPQARASVPPARFLIQ